jgi:UDP-N-acetylmuramoyl-L-alanyl-D-glutamate--2,6-diaminopimelate ligase
MPPRRSIRLDELRRALPESERPAPGARVAAGPAAEISSLAYDSRRVEAGALFCCIPGFEHDGHDFAPLALARGAVALLTERSLALGVPEVEVPSVRAAMGPLAARFYGDPSAQLRVVGVTGTNGKTTTSYLVRAMLERAGKRCGLLGTVKSVIGTREQPVVRTTPEAIDLQADLRAMLDAGDSHCAMEVSSHALALRRTDGLRFAVEIFTNLTQDHLDFHTDMEDYFQAKRRLFAAGGVAVINVGDPYGQRLASELPDSLKFAVEHEGRGLDADYFASDVHCERSGSRFLLHTPWGRREVTLPLAGRYNVANALAALTAAHVLAPDLDMLVAALEDGVRVPGRLEAVEEGQDFAVLVDYAHTPDSLARVSAAARELAAAAAEARPEGRVLLVFGAGGDRDRGKRPLMGEAGARGADLLIVTSDNPRSEQPRQILAEILAGVRRAQRVGAAAGRPKEDAAAAQADGKAASEVRVIADRREAIERALALARTGDVVVIAGKGHEQGQELSGGRVIPFDDVAVARESLRAHRLGARGAGQSGAPA